MTYLELCHALCREAGIPSETLEEVTGNVGELDRVCHWIQQAWDELRMHREDWQWPRGLAKKDDTPPGFPERFHMAIVYLALQKYAAYEAAPEVYAYALDRYNYYLTRIEEYQFYPLRFAGALA
jgi:hypothetical protein